MTSLKKEMSGFLKDVSNDFSSVILVDDDNMAYGIAEKLIAHEKGLKHRAFSVFIMRIEQGKKQILLQKRAPHKYHAGNLWSNTCCSHPQWGHSIKQDAELRLFQEMGLHAQLKEIGTFEYHFAFDNGLIEDEISHVFLGRYEPTEDQVPFNPDEVCDTQWIDIDASLDPNTITPWFPKALDVLTSIFKHAY